MSIVTALQFNPDCNTVAEVKLAAMILRDLINKRAMLQDACSNDADMIAGSFLNSFDTLTQNIEVNK